MSISAGSRGAAGNKIPKGYSAGRLQQFTPEQQSLYQSLFPYVSPGSQLAQQAQGSDQGFAPYEDYANRQFQEFSGQNASRFSGGNQGSGANYNGQMSARRGSGFQNLATQGAQDFASQLAMQRQELQRNALQDLMGISQSLLGNQPSTPYLMPKQQKQPGFWSKLFGAAAPIAGAGIGGALGGPFGASMGAQLGSGFSQGFQPTQWG
jgi:hypothetical protein